MGWFTRIDDELLEWELDRWAWLTEALSPAHDINGASKDTDPKLAAVHLSTNPRHYFKAYYSELMKRHKNSIQELKRLTRDFEQNIHGNGNPAPKG